MHLLEVDTPFIVARLTSRVESTETICRSFRGSQC